MYLRTNYVVVTRLLRMSDRRKCFRQIKKVMLIFLFLIIHGSRTDTFQKKIMTILFQEGWEQNVKTSKSGALHCSYCGKEYPSISTLRRHMPVHTGEKKFECENCTQRFTQSSSLYKHLKKANCVK